MGEPRSPTPGNGWVRLLIALAAMLVAALAVGPRAGQRTVGDLLAHEIRDLLAMCEADRPYAGMVRQLVAEYEPA